MGEYIQYIYMYTHTTAILKNPNGLMTIPESNSDPAACSSCCQVLAAPSLWAKHLWDSMGKRRGNIIELSFYICLFFLWENYGKTHLGLGDSPLTKLNDGSDLEGLQIQNDSNGLSLEISLGNAPTGRPYRNCCRMRPHQYWDRRRAP